MFKFQLNDVSSVHKDGNEMDKLREDALKIQNAKEIDYSADHNHPYGKSESILSFTSEDKITINEEVLRQIFEHPELQNRKIVVFSIIGAYRKGKSFFLDYCLRFLYAHVS